MKKGYISDNFVQLFVRRSIKRSPIINRGMKLHFVLFRMFLSHVSPLRFSVPRLHISGCSIYILPCFLKKLLSHIFIFCRPGLIYDIRLPSHVFVEFVSVPG